MKLIISTFALLFMFMSNGVVKKHDNTTTSKIASVKYESPKTFGFGESTYVDIDRDGRNDFQFTTIMTQSDKGIHHKYLVNALDKNEVLAVDDQIAFAEKDEVIKDNSRFINLKWTPAISEIVEQIEDGNTNQWNGLYSGDREQYVAIKLFHNGKAHYGWVKVAMNPDNFTAKVEGYAINRVPGQNISAGQI